jgi:PAS domain S-box-containing protein
MLETVPGGLLPADAEELRRLREFFDRASIGIHIVDADGVILKSNQTGAELLGFDEAELLGRNIRDIYEDDAGRSLLSALTYGERYRQSRVRLRRSDGSLRDVLLDAAASIVDGRLVEAQFFLRDLTEVIERQQAAVVQVRANEERARLAESTARFGTWEWDLGSTVTWSTAMEEVNGFEPGTFPGTFEAYIERVHPDDRAHTMEAVQQAIDHGTELDFEHRILMADGSFRWVNGRGRVLTDEAGHAVRMIGIGMDITERVEARAAVAEAQRREHTLAEITAHVASSLDPQEILAHLARACVPLIADVCSIGLFDEQNRTVRFENAGVSEQMLPAAARIHLRRWKEHPGSDRTVGDAAAAGATMFAPYFNDAWIDACAPDDEQKDLVRPMGVTSLMCVPLRSRGQTIGIATFSMTTSGRHFTHEDLALIKELAGRASVAVDNAHLVEDLRDTAENLRRANAAKDEFLGLVSHELKTPITTILGNAEVLLRNYDRLEPTVRNEALADVRAEADRLHRIVDNLLVLARLDRGQQLEIEPIHLRQLTERVADMFRRSYPAREFNVTWDCGMTLASGSPDYVEQVLRNLLSNAAKYSPPGSPIDIVARSDGGELSVSVLDRGAGITDEEAEALFTPFYRSEKTAMQAQGVGIGLAVCKRLIEAQAGRLWARTREGGGSEFGFALPLVDLD